MKYFFTLSIALGIVATFVGTSSGQNGPNLPLKTCYAVQTSPTGTMWVIQYRTSENGPWIDWRAGISSQSQAQQELFFNVEHGQFPSNAVSSRIIERERPPNWTTVAEYGSRTLAYRHLRQLSRRPGVRARVLTFRKLVKPATSRITLPPQATANLQVDQELRPQIKEEHVPSDINKTVPGLPDKDSPKTNPRDPTPDPAPIKSLRSR